MDTTTRPGINHAIKCLQKDGHDIAISWQRGKAIITRRNDARELSPLLSVRDMDRWLSGYIVGYGNGSRDGYRQGCEQGREQGREG